MSQNSQSEQSIDAQIGGAGTPAGQTTSFDLNRFVPFLLNRAATRVAGSFSNTLKEHGMTITTWRLMASLYQHDTLRIGELSEFTSIELWTVSRMITRLEEDGFIRRERVGRDARTVNAALTNKGRDLVETLIPEAHLQESGAIEGFTPEEVAQLQQLLHRIYRNLDASGS